MPPRRAEQPQGQPQLGSQLTPLSRVLQPILVPNDGYAAVRAILLREGYGGALFKMAAAVLLNHVRRLTIPWLGQPLFLNTFEYMKLAAKTPYFGLQSLLEKPLWEVLSWVVMIVAVTYARNMVTALLLNREIMVIQQDAARVSKRDRIFSDALLVLVLTIGVGALEYVYGQMAWTVSTFIALGRVFGDKDTKLRTMLIQHAALGGFDTMAKAMVYVRVGGDIIRSAWNSVQTRLAENVLLYAVAWVVIQGSVEAAVKHNKYFIFLEAREMLVTVAWLVLAAVTVGVWKMQGAAGDDEVRQKKKQTKKTR